MEPIKIKRSRSSSSDTVMDILFVSKKLKQHKEEEHSAKEEQEEPIKVKGSRNSSLSSKGASSDVDFWTQLSDEVVLCILSLLPKKDLVTSSLISRRFRDLSRGKL